MPFTPTHIVAVLPFWPLRRIAPFSAFVIGAVVPDVPLFFPVVDYAQMHSRLGLFTLCLPMGMAAFFVFELVMRRPTIAMLPTWFGSRLSSKPNISAQLSVGDQLRYVVAIAFAIVIGAYTHQIWDAFTHKGQWGTHLIPILNSYLEMGGFQLPGYKIFQHGSTFVGLPLLGLFAARELNRTAPTLRQDTLPFKWKRLAGYSICMVPIWVAIHAYMVSPSIYQALFLTITRSGSILMVMLFAYCLLFHAFVERDPDA